MPGLVAGGTLTTETDGLRVELASEPEYPAAARPTTYRLRLSNLDGSPVTAVKVTLQGRMADGMTVVAPLRAAPEPGVYRAHVLTMEWRWDLKPRAITKGKPFEVTLTEHVTR
jgi:hypothetical protein